MPPKWFYPLVATCLVAWTVKEVLKSRYFVATINDSLPIMVDTWRQTMCLPTTSVTEVGRCFKYPKYEYTP